MDRKDRDGDVDDGGRGGTKMKEVGGEREKNILLEGGDVLCGDVYLRKWEGVGDVKVMKLMK